MITDLVQRAINSLAANGFEFTRSYSAASQANWQAAQVRCCNLLKKSEVRSAILIYLESINADALTTASLLKVRMLHDRLLAMEVESKQS